jgi:hypothetical protein
LLLLLGVAGILVADRILEVAQARAAAITSAREEILAITTDSARRQADLVSDARAILTLAAALPESDGRSLTGCQVPFRRAVKARPWLISLTVIHPTGMAVCTSADRLLPRSLADREYFRNAIATRGLVLSDYIISRLTGQPIIVAAMPRIENSRVESVVSASIDVSSFNRLAAETGGRSDAEILLMDSHGTVIAAHPHPEQWVGKNLAVEQDFWAGGAQA